MEHDACGLVQFSIVQVVAASYRAKTNLTVLVPRQTWSAGKTLLLQVHPHRQVALAASRCQPGVSQVDLQFFNSLAAQTAVQCFRLRPHVTSATRTTKHASNQTPYRIQAAKDLKGLCNPLQEIEGDHHMHREHGAIIHRHHGAPIHHRVHRRGHRYRGVCCQKLEPKWLWKKRCLFFLFGVVDERMHE